MMKAPMVPAARRQQQQQQQQQQSCVPLPLPHSTAAAVVASLWGPNM
jgi:hypothetical protein